MSLELLYKSLSERKRPEDVADMILDLIGEALSLKERTYVLHAAKSSLKRSFWKYTSMLQTFAKPIGMEKQLRTAIDVFGLDENLNFDARRVDAIEIFVQTTGKLIYKEMGANNFVGDRLNKEERKEIGLHISKRRYNKQWRILKRMEKKVSQLARNIKKSEFEHIAKHGLAHRIAKEDFSKDLDTACFVAYFTARNNLRSQFTIFGQVKPFDEICNILFKRCLNRKNGTTDWWTIAQVYPKVEVLQRLSDEEKGHLLGKWMVMLEELSDWLAELWQENIIDRQTMVVQRGNDSTTWNQAASAWNKARDSWMNLIYATGTEYILDNLCFGKAMRLVAGDLAFYHRLVGHAPEPNTRVWNLIPLPWEVLTGEKFCNRAMVEAACQKVGLDPEASGWLAPRPQKVEKFMPTPELVHGVSISNPFLAKVLRKHKYYSGKPAKVKPIDMD